MPTVGELLEQLRNGAMKPEGTGDSPYSGIEPGTNSPIAQTNIDDLPDDTKTCLLYTSDAADEP